MRGGHLDRQPDPRRTWAAALTIAFRINPGTITSADAEQLHALLSAIAARIDRDRQRERTR